MALDRQDLKSLKQIADKKLAKMGIHLDYRVIPSKAGSSSSDQGQPVYLDGRDTTAFGNVAPGKLNLLLHELGHKFLYQQIPWSIRKSDEFTKLFGPIQKTYKRKPGIKKEEPHYISKYAQAHPQEDFAEIFTIYTKHNGDLDAIERVLSKKEKNHLVRAQVHWLHNFLSGKRAGPVGKLEHQSPTKSWERQQLSRAYRVA